ncbi:MAG: FHIPEP family type III secretion protein [Vulcanimicrobiota bacterium]
MSLSDPKKNSGPTRTIVLAVRTRYTACRAAGSERSNESKRRERGLLLFTPTAVFANHLTDICRHHADRLFTYQHWCCLRDHHRKTSPHLYKALRRQGIRSVQVWQVLRELLQEQVSIRDLTTILQTLLERPGQSQAQWVEASRTALSGYLTETCQSSPGTLEVVRMDPGQEETLRRAEPDQLRRLAQELVEMLQLPTQGGWGVHFLTESDCRRTLRDLLKPSLPRAVFLSLNELPPDLTLRPLLTI